MSELYSQNFAENAFNNAFNNVNLYSVTLPDSI